VDLVHVHGETSCSVETATTAVAFEMLGLLMRNEKLQIFKITFTVVTPRAMDDLLDVGVTAPFLAHLVGLFGYDIQVRR
jgi:hypothetical protein